MTLIKEILSRGGSGTPGSKTGRRRGGGDYIVISSPQAPVLNKKGAKKVKILTLYADTEPCKCFMVLINLQ